MASLFESVLDLTEADQASVMSLSEVPMLLALATSASTSTPRTIPRALPTIPPLAANSKILLAILLTMSYQMLVMDLAAAVKVFTTPSDQIPHRAVMPCTAVPIAAVKSPLDSWLMIFPIV